MHHGRATVLDKRTFDRGLIPNVTLNDGRTSSADLLNVGRKHPIAVTKIVKDNHVLASA
jgi:hypothetical protein